MEKVINEHDLTKFINDLELVFEEFRENADKNVKGNKTAGKRARALSIELCKNMKVFRKLTLDRDKTLGRKSK